MHNSAIKISTGTAKEGEKDPVENLEHLTEEYLADGHRQLEQALETRRRLLGAMHIATGEVQFTLGLFELYLLGNNDAAEAFVAAAQKSYESQLGPDHPSAIHVTNCLAMVMQRL